MTEETVKAWFHDANGTPYDVWAPADLADQLNEHPDEGWVSLALVNSDEYICLRARDIVFFRRDMTAEEKRRRG